MISVFLVTIFLLLSVAWLFEQLLVNQKIQDFLLNYYGGSLLFNMILAYEKAKSVDNLNDN